MQHHQSFCLRNPLISTKMRLCQSPIYHLPSIIGLKYSIWIFKHKKEVVEILMSMLHYTHFRPNQQRYTNFPHKWTITSITVIMGSYMFFRVPSDSTFISCTWCQPLFSSSSTLKYSLSAQFGNTVHALKWPELPGWALPNVWAPKSNNKIKLF